MGNPMKIFVWFNGSMVHISPMKSLTALLAVVALAISSPAFAAEQSVAWEPLGKIALDQKADVVLKLLGKPASKGEDKFNEATAEWLQQWKFPALGLDLVMASAKKGAGKKVSTIKATAKCQLATARGIAIGSSIEAVRRAYGNPKDNYGSTTGESFVAGSIYDGIIFTLKAGKVAGIFIGAAAE